MMSVTTPRLTLEICGKPQRLNAAMPTGRHCNE
jgi:hypothetical protein